MKIRIRCRQLLSVHHRRISLHHQAALKQALQFARQNGREDAQEVIEKRLMEVRQAAPPQNGEEVQLKITKSGWVIMLTRCAQSLKFTKHYNLQSKNIPRHLF